MKKFYKIWYEPTIYGDRRSYTVWYTEHQSLWSKIKETALFIKAMYNGEVRIKP